MKDAVLTVCLKTYNNLDKLKEHLELIGIKKEYSEKMAVLMLEYRNKRKNAL